MADRELEQALIAAFEAVLGSQQNVGLPLAGAGKVVHLDQTASELETLAAEVQRITARPLSERTSTLPYDEARVGTTSGVAYASSATTSLSGGSSTMGTNRPSAEAEDNRTAQSIVQTVLKTGLGAVPLIRLFTGLFGGGDAQAPPPLVKYAAPQAIRLERANADPQDGRLSLAEFDYDQRGYQRRVQEPTPASQITVRQEQSPTEQADVPRAPQITVNVQAMDSRSFLDHSNEIALAVREAMLNMHALNDVVGDL